MEISSVMKRRVLLQFASKGSTLVKHDLQTGEWIRFLEAEIHS